MKTAAALFSAVFVLCAAAFAQTQSQPSQSFATGTMVTVAPDGQRTTTVVMVPISACPVSMQAKQRGLAELVKSRKTPQSNMPKPAQHIHLILKDLSKDKRVVSAEVTARGLSAHSRMQQTLQSGEGSSDIRKTQWVDFAPDQDSTVSADIDLPAFTAVNAVRLDWIVYSDGSSWKPEKETLCTVAPDPVMLIAGR